MAVYDYDLGIIGAGAAGIAAAKAAARVGGKTILIEKSEKSWGGCFHSGCISSKTLIRSAQVWSLARRAEEFGLPKLSLPPVSMAQLTARLRSVVDVVREKDSCECLRKLGITVRFGEAKFVDKLQGSKEAGESDRKSDVKGKVGEARSIENRSVVVGGETITAEAWIIATGSRAAVPALEGLEEVPYWTTDTIFSMERFPQRLLVLGGGPAGVELAQAFCRLGSQVSIIEIEQQLLPSEDEDIADLLEKRLAAEGVDVCTGTTPLKVEGTDSMVRLTVSRTAGGAEPWTIEGDALLVAVGRAPNTEELDLDAMKVPFFPRGIPTYPSTRTGIRGIYACGDVNGLFPYAHIAEFEAEAAVSNVLLKISKRVDYSKIPWCTYTDPEIATIGYNEKKAKAGGVEYSLHTASFKEIDMAFVEGAPEGLIKVLTDSKGTVLGCQIIGCRAGELIHEWAAAVNGRAKIADMAGWVHVYPTLAGITKKVVDSIHSTRVNQGRSQKFMRFLLGLRGKR